MHYVLKITILIIILALVQSPGCGQIVKDRKLIIGIWVAEDKSSQLEFKATGECFESAPSSKVSDVYTYKIIDIMPNCSPKESMIIDPKQTVTFLEMIEKGTGLQYCYQINGITATTLSLRMLGSGGYILYKRKK